MGNIPHVNVMSKIRWGHGDGIDSESLVTQNTRVKSLVLIS